MADIKINSAEHAHRNARSRARRTVHPMLDHKAVASITRKAAKMITLYGIISEKAFDFLYRVGKRFFAILSYMLQQIAKSLTPLIKEGKVRLDSADLGPRWFREKLIARIRHISIMYRGWLSEYYNKFRNSAAGALFIKGWRGSERPAIYTAMIGIGISVLVLGHYFARSGHVLKNDALETNAPRGLVETAERLEARTSSADSRKASQSSTPTLLAYKLKRGETFVTLLERAGVSSKNAHGWAQTLSGAIDMRRLRIGDMFDVAVRDDDIVQFKHRMAFDSEISAWSEGGNRIVETTSLPLKNMVYYASGIIKNSLYKTASREGVADTVIENMINILAFDVDFQRDIRAGDTFELYYERQYSPDYKDYKDGRILYVTLSANNRPITASWFTPQKGRSGYFGEDGLSVRKALMKTPVDGARLSSTFGKRKHPVLGYTRMHKGVDFAAPRGTPIKAAGDGVIDFIGRNGGYGNFVRIRHGSTYMTNYAHLTRFSKGLKKGSNVSQGDIIGTIGSTGLATGPHLHYEVLRNGVQVDPRRLKLPEAQRLEGANFDMFKAALASTRREISMIREGMSLKGKALAEQDVMNAQAQHANSAKSASR